MSAGRQRELADMLKGGRTKTTVTTTTTDEDVLGAEVVEREKQRITSVVAPERSRIHRPGHVDHNVPIPDFDCGDEQPPAPDQVFNRARHHHSQQIQPWRHGQFGFIAHPSQRREVAR